MELNINQIKEIATGVVRVESCDGLIRLYRFTKEQEEFYKNRNSEFYEKSFCTAGIRLAFETDSENLFLEFVTSKKTTRTYYSVDVFVDGTPVEFIDNFSDTVLPRNYPPHKLPLGEMSKNIKLGKGVKTVCIYLPWSVELAIKRIELDDNSFLKGIKSQKKLLSYGDSITQGYDAQRPSNRYIGNLADKLNAEEINKAIGGEVFCPRLAELKDDFTPDYITVAYGTNDWATADEETFKTNCKGFFDNLTSNYPNIKTLVITPIARMDMNEETNGWSFKSIDKNIREIVKDYKNIAVISGLSFVPAEEEYFADLFLHPNDEGFKHYTENLINEIDIREFGRK